MLEEPVQLYYAFCHRFLISPGTPGKPANRSPKWSRQSNSGTPADRPAVHFAKECFGKRTDPILGVNFHILTGSYTPR
jgi:hypothetical protein